MFPIRWNFPFRKKDGSISTIGDEISAGGGGGGGYELPTATASRLGGVKIGSGITVQEDGTISANGGSPYVLPTASAETLGGIKVGNGLSIDENGVLSASGGSGGNVYNHNIEIDTNDAHIFLNIVTNSDTAFTFSSLCSLLNSKNVSDGFPATGYKNNSGTYSPIIRVYKNTSNSLYYTELVSNNYNNYSISSNAVSYFHDVVI